VKRNIVELHQLTQTCPRTILKTKDVLEYFGYAKGTSINRSRLHRFNLVSFFRYKHPKTFWKLNKKYALIRWDDYHEFLFKKFPVPSSNSYGGQIRYIKDHRKTYFLVIREILPFWLLKEYGGRLP